MLSSTNSFLYIPSIFDYFAFKINFFRHLILSKKLKKYILFKSAKKIEIK